MTCQFYTFYRQKHAILRNSSHFRAYRVNIHSILMDIGVNIFQILNEIAQHKIKIYDFPEPLEDEEEAKALRQLRSRVPFAIVGANTVIEIDGRKVRGRRYPWGTAEGIFSI